MKSPIWAIIRFFWWILVMMIDEIVRSFQATQSHTPGRKGWAMWCGFQPRLARQSPRLEAASTKNRLSVDAISL
jgi:hypothetical protein